jgi:hypothetical protein
LSFPRRLVLAANRYLQTPRCSIKESERGMTRM